LALVPERGARQRLEVDVVEADVADLALGRAVLAAPAVDEIDQRVAHALDRRDVELPRPGLVREAPRAEAGGARVRARRVLHAKGDRAYARAVHPREALCERVGLR